MLVLTLIRRRRILMCAAIALLPFAAMKSFVLGQSASIANVGLTRGWATFGQAVPQGTAYESLQLGSLMTQTDVKSRWPDGSIRFAIVSAQVPAAGTYQLRAGRPVSGSVAPRIPRASVTLTIDGIPYTAALASNPSADLWLNGPLVYEGRTVVVPQSATGPHPFIRVNFDTRVYNDGKARVDVAVENLLDKDGARTVACDVTISIDGRVVFARNGVQHYYLTRWRK